jgi:phosphatidate cytidylyltransferase
MEGRREGRAPSRESRESRREPRPRRQRSGTGSRVIVAIPLIAFAIVIVGYGGAVWAFGLLILGVLALTELYTLMERVRPVNLAGFITLAALIAAALYGEPRHVLMVFAASFPLVFFLAFLRPRRAHVSWAIAATMFGILWIGLAMVHAIFLRELPEGDGLVVDVLIGTFLGDTAAYFVGRAYGRRPLAPTISPKKTVEGLIGGILGGTVAFWCAGLYQDWLSGSDALLIGFVVALTAPVGDLFESMIKRDLEVKDTGTIFGPHGGVLDRLDAALFTIVIGYYASVALGYG